MKNNIVKIICAIIVSIVAITLIFTRKLYFRIDLTEEKLYSLSDASKEMLKKMEEPLTLKLYLSGELDANMLRLKHSVEDMVYEMDMEASESIEIEETDPNEEEDDESRYMTYSKLEERGLRGMTVMLKGKGGKMTEQVIFPWAEMCSSKDTIAICLMQPSQTASGEEAVNRAIEDLEYQLIDAVRVLNMKEIKKIAFIEGHGELPEEQVYDASDALSRYFQVDRGVLGDDASILDGYSAIIIAKPVTKFSESDKFIIDQYIMRGGRVLWLIDGVKMSNNMLSEGGKTPLIALDLNLQDQLFKYGARITSTVIEDMQCAYIPVNIARETEAPRFESIPWFFTPLLKTSPYHPITKKVSSVRGDFASGIEIVGKNNEIEKAPLLVSSNASHVSAAPSEIDVMGAINVEPQKYFTTSFVPVAMALEGEFQSVYQHRMAPSGMKNATIKEKSEKTRMVVVADGDIISNDIEKRPEGLMLVPLGYDRVTRQTHGNRDFIVNTMLYLTDSEGVMDLRNRKIELRLLNRALVESQREMWMLINTLVPLVLLAIFGITYILIRKKKYKK